MLRFVATKVGGGKLIGLGLSQENCARLLADEPIVLDLQEDLSLNWQGEILLFAAEDEMALAQKVKAFADTSQAEFHRDADAHPGPATSSAAAVDPGTGQIQFQIAADPESKKVVMRFNKQIAWIAFPPQMALAVAQALVDKARLTALQSSPVIIPGDSGFRM